MERHSTFLPMKISEKILSSFAKRRVLVSGSPEKQNEFIEYMISKTHEFTLLGEVTPSNIVVDNNDWGDVKEWKEVYEEAIGKEMNQSVEA